MMMESFPLPFASLENRFLRIDYLTTVGPRIIGLYFKGLKNNLLAETPAIHWSTPHGEYYLHGGHRLWTAPENPFYTCPENSLLMLADHDKVVLRSSVDASGLEKEISLHLEENCVRLMHRVTWHGRKRIAFAAWAITQMQLGGMAILPQPDSEGLLPNRKIVLWPYSRLNDARLELHDDVILVHGRASEEALKIGQYNSHGWVAYARDDLLFVKRFSVDPTNNYPDMGCNVEAYVRESCVELETLGPLTTLEPGAFITYEETWEVNAGEYPATVETARRVSKQLSRN
jgi:hypothetical protein